jgi:hypothetical protein
MPAAPVGGDDPLAALQPLEISNADVTVGEGVCRSDLKYIRYGPDPSILPYTIENNYEELREPREFRVAVLENAHLRATFLLECGGRLWSLFHKATGRELLCSNPVLQPRNLAVRGAWFSGGVEWNGIVKGHSPFTCSPVFAARVADGSGRVALRLYEWERQLQAPYQIDAYLPAASGVLLVRIRLTNPHRREMPMYWWSNIAVTESPGTRILAPACDGLAAGHERMLRRVDVPINRGIDITYPKNRALAAELFYRIPGGSRPWIAALDADGCGLIQTSTSRLGGRKLFVWGMGHSGRRWQEFLSCPGARPYIEIQAGLAQTQLEYLPMAAGSEWSWLEAYGYLDADAAVVHGDDWDRACRHVEVGLGRMIGPEALERELADSKAMGAKGPQEILHRGSGWGALERIRRRQAGEPPMCDEALVFDDDAMGEQQGPWVDLLETGALAESDPARAPVSWMVQDQWHEMLAESIRSGRSDHWLAWLHLGVMRYGAGDSASARQAWEKSRSLEPTAWADRNLAVIARKEGKTDKAAELLLEAHRKQPAVRSLAVECFEALIDAGRAEEVVALAEALDPPIRQHGRIRAWQAAAALKAGHLDVVERFFAEEPNIADLRESETFLTDLWFGMHERQIAALEGCPIDAHLRSRVWREFPPPAFIDFRMFE